MHKTTFGRLIMTTALAGLAGISAFGLFRLGEPVATQPDSVLAASADSSLGAVKAASSAEDSLSAPEVSSTSLVSQATSLPPAPVGNGVIDPLEIVELRRAANLSTTTTTTSTTSTSTTSTSSTTSTTLAPTTTTTLAPTTTLPAPPAALDWGSPPWNREWCGVPAELDAAWRQLPAQVRSEVKAWGICLRFETTTAFGKRFGLELSSHWGVANPFKGELAVSPKAPSDRRFDVLAHELAHLSPGLVHGYIDGSLRGKAAEVAADKRACEWGATWVNYLGSC